MAPFQVLAAGIAGESAATPGRTFHDRDHLWHLAHANVYRARPNSEYRAAG